MSSEGNKRLDSDTSFPRHIAIIMDGNGRWAEERGLPRVQGHREGIKSVREVTTECARMGVESLTLYAFSVENWKRPVAEVGFLMKLLSRFLVRERDTLMENDVRLTAIGRLDDLPSAALAELRRTEELTAKNTGMRLRLALSYGGRAEIVDATRAIAAKARAGSLAPDEVDEDLFREHLYDPGTPDPDLMIRTAGEMRISNFLLWQISYTELVVTSVCWPEFRLPQLKEAIAKYGGRIRKFGGLAQEQTPRAEAGHSADA